MTDRDLMQQALEALKSCSSVTHYPVLQLTIKALRERLAQPETEAEIYKRLYELRGKALDRPCSRCGYQPKRIYPMAQPEQSRAEKMRDAGYTRRPTLRELAIEDQQPEQTVSVDEYKRLQELVTSQGIRLMEYESEQEPVAWMIEWNGGPTGNLFRDESYALREMLRLNALHPQDKRRLVPLYTTPQPRQWQGLSKEDRYMSIRPLYRDDASAALAAAHSNDEYEAIEAKLREKNT